MIGSQSTMERPDWVRRVIPPITTIRAIRTAPVRSQMKTGRCLGSIDTKVKVEPLKGPIGDGQLLKEGPITKRLAQVNQRKGGLRMKPSPIFLKFAERTLKQ